MKTLTEILKTEIAPTNTRKEFNESMEQLRKMVEKKNEEKKYEIKYNKNWNYDI